MKISWLPVLALMALTTWGGGAPDARGAEPRTLKGPSFSDPGDVTSRSEAWVNQPIQYEKWAGKADLAVVLDQHQYTSLLPMIEDYARQNKISVMVKDGTCGVSEGMLKRKRVDMGGFCCPPAKADRLPGLKYHTLGIAPLTILVHPENPIDNLTVDEVRQIFRGQIINWKSIKDADGRPGPDLRIRPVGRLHCKIRPGHWRQILDNEDLFSPRLQGVGAIQDMVTSVADYRGAIGWVEAMNIARFAHLGKVRAVRINGINPMNLQALASGTYPFYRTQNVTTWDQEGLNNPHAGKLLEFLKKGVAAGPNDVTHLIPTPTLVEAGWIFQDGELVGEPR